MATPAALPIAAFRYAGVWNVTTYYNFADLVISPIDDQAYVNATNGVTGGSDPSVQPSFVWALCPQSFVSQLVAGTNVTLTPTSGVGAVTIDATVGAGGVDKIIAGTNITISPLSGLGDVTINAPALSFFVDSFQIYVAPNGSDTTGTGSQQKPF